MIRNGTLHLAQPRQNRSSVLEFSLYMLVHALRAGEQGIHQIIVYVAGVSVYLELQYPQVCSLYHTWLAFKCYLSFIQGTIKIRTDQDQLEIPSTVSLQFSTVSISCCLQKKVSSGQTYGTLPVSSSVSRTGC